ncbi:hypothetical protein J6590_016374 [Homalodisca vitripennis]|nr:hypothetical protein J6590_016373 [Homalodisca vitripennis]KAG8293416.1 hypothetical protein J6590_016374 [Homalodisca vitripennis]
MDGKKVQERWPSGRTERASYWLRSKHAARDQSGNLHRSCSVTRSIRQRSDWSTSSPHPSKPRPLTSSPTPHRHASPRAPCWRRLELRGVAWCRRLQLWWCSLVVGIKAQKVYGVDDGYRVRVLRIARLSRSPWSEELCRDRV